jgi:outer membrane protein assembly factor BamB
MVMARGWVVDVGHAEARFVGGSAQRVWVRAKEHLLALDALTGETSAHLRLADLFYPKVLEVGGQWLLLDRDQVAGLDAHSVTFSVGAPPFVHAVATTRALILVLAEPTRVRRLDPKTGHLLDETVLEGTSYPSSVTVAGAQVFVRGTDGAVCCFDGDGGRVSWRTELPPEAKGDFMHPGFVLGGAYHTPADVFRRGGAHTKLTPLSLRDGAPGDSLELPGALRFFEPCGSFVIAIEGEGAATRAVAFAPDLVPMARALGASAFVKGSDTLGVCVAEDRVVLAHRIGARIVFATGPTPLGGLPFVVGSRVFLDEHGRVACLDVGDVVPGEDFDLSVTESVLRRPAPTRSFAAVTYVGQASAVFQHPDLGRLTVVLGSDSPPIALGEAICLDDFEQRPGGVVSVLAWRPASELQREPVAPVTTELRAADLPPIDPASGAPRPRLGAALRGRAKERGVELPPLIERLIGLAEDDLVVETLIGSLLWKDEAPEPVSDEEEALVSQPGLVVLGSDGFDLAYLLWKRPDDASVAVLTLDRTTLDVMWVGDPETFVAERLRESGASFPTRLHVFVALAELQASLLAKTTGDAPPCFRATFPRG